MSRSRSLLMCGAAALALAAASHPAEAASPVDVALGGARVDMIARDHFVASFEASGSIRGLFTATIRTTDGKVGGEWVLVSRYLRDITPDGKPDTLAADERAALPGWDLHARHQEHFEIHERGTLRGTIAGGALSYDVDGRLRSIDGLELAIAGGDREFAGMSGTGSLSGSGLHDKGVGTVSLAPLAPKASDLAEVK